MISVDRISSILPPSLVTRAARMSEAVIAEALALGSQQRLEFKSPVWREFLPALRVLFHGKCAYCESPLLATGDAYLDHFRPKAGVEEDAQHRGYFWLAYDWNNMVLVCGACNLNKRNHFPVGGTRAYLPGDPLEHELALLLDPCKDFPDQHLEFDPDSGIVASRDTRGDITIRTLGLNRAPLVEARLTASRDAGLKLNLAKRSRSTHGVASVLKDLRSATAPFAAMRQAVGLRFEKKISEAPTGKIRGRARQAVRGGSTEQRPELAVSPAPKLSAPPRTGYIRRVVIQNFRSIEELDLTFGYARGDHIGWQVLLGENGVGKSSILQAIALALIGEKKASALGLNIESTLRRTSTQSPAPQSGWIQVWLDSDPEPIEISFDGTSFNHVRGAEGAQSFVRGFGPTRLLPKHRGIPADEADTDAAAASDPMRQVANLFDPYVPLCDAVAWLETLSTDEFSKVAQTIKDVLRIRNEDNLVFDRAAGAVKVTDASGVPMSIDLLSHGQQSALVLATDIVSGIMAYRSSAGMPRVPNDFSQCGGIILLDEIDAHLHPRWKMEIVSSLKHAFPNIQFIATTHEPLCLVGLDEGEIVIVRRQDGTVAAEVSPVSPKGWRVDQLLTSELFGLFSTIDPKLDDQFQEYYLLLSKQDFGLKPKELERLAHLRGIVQSHSRLGYTRRDQLLYEVIDEYMVKELQLKTYDRKMELREQTKQRLRDIWARVELTRPRQT